jgi:hypothetical protein
MRYKATTSPKKTTMIIAAETILCEDVIGKV